MADASADPISSGREARAIRSLKCCAESRPVPELALKRSRDESKRAAMVHGEQERAFGQAQRALLDRARQPNRLQPVSALEAFPSLRTETHHRAGATMSMVCP